MKIEFLSLFSYLQLYSYIRSMSSRNCARSFVSHGKIARIKSLKPYIDTTSCPEHIVMSDSPIKYRVVVFRRCTFIPYTYPFIYFCICLGAKSYNLSFWLLQTFDSHAGINLGTKIYRDTCRQQRQMKWRDVLCLISDSHSCFVAPQCSK